MASKRKKRQKSNRPAVLNVLHYRDRLNKRVWKKIIRRDPCSYCGKPATKIYPSTADHIIPRSSLIEECNWENFVPACSACNNKKADKPFLEFIFEMVESGDFLNHEHR